MKGNFYNAYRPRQFAEVLGQDQSIGILRKQAMLGAFGHSYLLYGASGSGKTSTARILAMALNCQSLNGGEPCLKCQPCRLIPEGNYWDCLEIDGARFSRVEEARELVGV